MVAGQRGNVKVGFIIQARMQSTRLPGKVMLPLPLPNGKPMLSWIVDGVKQSAVPHSIVVATSANQENNPIEIYCQQEQVVCFRGDEDDVLSRFIALIKKYHFDKVVRLTGDNPCIDSTMLDEAIHYHSEGGYDYTHTTGLPLGMNFEIVNAKALLGLESELLSPPDREHVTLFVRESGKFKCGICHFETGVSHLRMTVDYPSDYAVVSAVLMAAQQMPGTKLDRIKQLHTWYPWLFEGNAQNVQKKLFASKEQEIMESISLLKRLEMFEAAKILTERN